MLSYSNRHKMMIAVCTSVSEGQIGTLSLDHVNFQEELAFKKAIAWV